MKIIKLGLLALLILTIAGSAVKMVLNGKEGGEVPSFTSTKDKITVPCDYSASDLLEGLTASDAEDGDLTEKILVGNFSGFISRGTADLEYVVFDSDGNHETCTREITFDGYKPPQIGFNRPCVFYANAVADGVLRQYISAYDVLDGDISKFVKVTDTDANFKVPGDYTFTAQVENSFGDTVRMEFPVHILDPADKGLAISLGAFVVYVDKGGGFDPEDYLLGVTEGGGGPTVPPESYTMTIDSDVNLSKDGMYEVHYSAVSEDGKLTGNTWLIVVVGDYGG